MIIELQIQVQMCTIKYGISSLGKHGIRTLDLVTVNADGKSRRKNESLQTPYFQHPTRQPSQTEQTATNNSDTYSNCHKNPSGRGQILFIIYKGLITQHPLNY